MVDPFWAGFAVCYLLAASVIFLTLWVDPDLVDERADWPAMAFFALAWPVSWLLA